MKRKIVKILSLLAVMLFTVSFTAFAENIDSVSLRFEGKIPALGDKVSNSSVNVYPQSGGVRITDWYFGNGVNKWKAGEIPNLIIHLEANGNGIFTSTSKSYFNLSGMNVKFEMAACNLEEDPQDMYLSVLFPQISGGAPDEPDDAYWSNFVARWSKVSGADQYKVRLFRDGRSGEIASSTVSGTSHNFQSKLTSEGYYYFEVRAVNSSGASGWEESDYIYISAQQAQINQGNSPVQPVGPGQQTGAFSSFWRQGPDGVWRVYDRYGNLVTNCWLCDDAVAANGKSVWYLLDANGNMVSCGLVRDAAGNYYSLETEHNGHYGMMRYASGTYGAIYLNLEQSHNGRYGAINNPEAVNALNAMYGCQDISGISTRLVYTSQF